VVDGPAPSPRRLRRRHELRLFDRVTGMIAGGQVGTVAS
jgi:hypothetical protein